MATIKIPYQQTSDRQVNQFQQSLSAALQPITSNPIASCIIITKVSLVAGANTIPIGLPQPLQGWFIIRQRAQADIWDSQDTNTTPSQTLILNASAPVVVDIGIF